MSLSTWSSPDFLSTLIQSQTPADFTSQDLRPLPTFTLPTISTPQQQPALSQRHSGASNSTGHRMRALLFRAKPERAQAPNPSTERDCCEFLRFITPQPPLIHPRQLSTTAPRDSHRPTDTRATTSIHLPPFSTSIRNGRRQGYELAQSEDSVIVLLLTHITGKSSGGKTGGKSGSGEAGKTQKSHSAKAGLQVRVIICHLHCTHHTVSRRGWRAARYIRRAGRRCSLCDFIWTSFACSSVACHSRTFTRPIQASNIANHVHSSHAVVSSVF